LTPPPCSVHRGKEEERGREGGVHALPASPSCCSHRRRGKLDAAGGGITHIWKQPAARSRMYGGSRKVWEQRC
jgi:hypothetical protein